MPKFYAKFPLLNGSFALAKAVTRWLYQQYSVLQGEHWIPMAPTGSLPSMLTLIVGNLRRWFHPGHCRKFHS